MNANIIVAVVVVAIVVGLYFIVNATTTTDFVSTETKAEPVAESRPSATPQLQPTVAAPTGLKIEILQEGTGVGAKAGDTVTVHYIGTLTNGQKFDASRDHGQPFDSAQDKTFSFPLGAGQVIKGWDQGVIGMKVGEQRRLTISPELGYGANGAGPIPPNSTLIFEIELLKIN